MASPIDKIFKDIFGYIPSKSGEAYERLSAIAAHMLEGGQVKHDDKLRGDISKTFYQLDAHQVVGSEASVIEAKDYTMKGRPVGRGDLQKLGGALPDLGGIKLGKFFSATNYTKPAKDYADASDQMLGKRMSLYRLELPNAEYDTNGFIKHILVRLHLLMPHAHQGELRPVFAEGGDTEVRSLFSGASNKDVFQVRVETLYDRGGNAVLTLKELT